MTKVKLNEAITILDDSVTSTLVFFEQLDPSNITTMLQAFQGLGVAHDRLSSLVKILGELYDKFSYEVIPNAFNWDDPNNRIEGLKVSGYNFILSTRVNASIPENMRAAGNKWVAEVAKCPDLLISRINPKQLTSLVKTHFETYAEYPPEDAVKVHQHPYIQVRKA